MQNLVSKHYSSDKRQHWQLSKLANDKIHFSLAARIGKTFTVRTPNMPLLFTGSNAVRDARRLMRQFISGFLVLIHLPIIAQELTPFGSVDDIFGAASEDSLELPGSIVINNVGPVETNFEDRSISYTGNVRVAADNGIQIKSDKAFFQSIEETVLLTGDTAILQEAVTLENGVVKAGIQMFADQTLLNLKEKTVTLDGNVSIYQGPQLHRGDHAVYNYETRKLDTGGLASGMGPLLIESNRFRMVEQGGKKTFVGDNAGITTHDVSDPNFWIRSDRTTIYPGEKVTFKNMSFYAGDRKIFWLPYLSQPLDAELGYHFLPGVRSSWGAFLLNRYGIMLGGDKNEETGERENAWLLSRWHFDLRSQRGVGLGFDLFDTRTESDGAFEGLKTYYLHDLDPSQEKFSRNRDKIDDDRWKFEFKQRLDFNERADSKTSLKFNITALSDRYFLEDLEEQVFRVNPNPDNEIGIYHQTPNYLAGIRTRFSPNQFYQTDTRLPEVFFEQVKQPIRQSGILYEGQTSWGVYKEKLADFTEDELRDEAATLTAGDSRLTEINDLLGETGFNRFNTWHELSRPFKIGNILAVNPHVGAGYTHYSSLNDQSGSFGRSHLALGVDLSTKFSRAYPDFMNDRWGINSLLHVVQPYVNFSEFTTDKLDDSFRGIETLIPSTRPRPLEVGRFTAVDDLSNWSIMRFGVRNELLTKRNGDTHSWLSTNTYIDSFFNDPEFNRDFSNLYNDVIWNPLPWLQLSFETQFPIVSSGANFREFSGNFTFMPSNSLEIKVGYRELENHPTLQDSRNLKLKAYKRISDTWGIGTFHRWELDDNVFEVQEYNIYRNFDSWTASAGIFANDYRSRKEYGLLLNFTLRAFPSLSLPLVGSTE